MVIPHSCAPRSTLSDLRRAQFVHMLSGLDHAPAPRRPGAALATTITGYTEWIGGPGCIWSVGWDWALDAATVVVLRRSSFPQTNLTLVSPSGDELAPERADRVLARLVDALPWQPCVLEHIARRYAA